ncbi:MAG: GDP-L-fucose synthase [Candidatus Thioglobus sp.]
MTKIYIAGHRGMVGSAIVRQLQTKPKYGFQLITRTHKELDLTNQQQVNDFIAKEKPDQIYLAAAKVGGIHANNTYPADFIYQNLIIQANIIHAAHQNNIQKLLFLGSSCIYPKYAKQPMREESLLTGTLEPTNEPYAVAKIAGIKLCESYNRQYNHDYRSVMPTNLYGPGDNYHPKNSHVIPALIRRFHEGKINNAQKIIIWGSGKPKREFLYVDDMAAACVYVMNLNKEVYQQQIEPMQSHINIGSGKDLTIKQLAESIAKVVGFEGKIEFDPTKPDGTKRKLMDSTRLNNLGWHSKFDLQQGIKQTYEDYCKFSN